MAHDLYRPTRYETVRNGRTPRTDILAVDGKDKEFEALQSCFDHGVGFVNFSDVSEDKTKPWPDRFIHWDRKHSLAEVDIGTAFASLSGGGNHIVLRKFFGQWVVIDMSDTWIS
ncbi:MAG TPA: hypothetical protein VG944_00240 [Fimbriimonas sp.]|nr:hypothetical protein [Fimbriimonas sp.]